MKDLYLDMYSGVSGDMLLGLLIDLGLDPAELERGLSGLSVGKFGILVHKERRGAIGGTRVELSCPDSAHDRHLNEIRDIIERSPLKTVVKERSIAVFTRLAEAEARVHRVHPEEIHFHEVGALDAIVDIVGVVLGLDLMGIGRINASALSVGKGFTECRHGRIPLPAPAVLELARGFPCRQVDISAELTTPTGAALVTTLARSFGDMPLTRVESVGYGLGTRELPIPNAVRGILGRIDEGTLDRVVLLESNIDNLNPEVYGYLYDVFFREGALDVYLTPIQMKKGRPGVKLSVLADQGRVDRMADLFFQETSTLGVRWTPMERRIVPRRTIEVETRFGPVRVKLSGGTVAPEYDDCLAVALKHKIPLKDVYEEVRASAVGKV